MALMKPDAPVMDSRLRGNDELGYERRMKREAPITRYDSADYLDSKEAMSTIFARREAM